MRMIAEMHAMLTIKHAVEILADLHVHLFVASSNLSKNPDALKPTINAIAEENNKLQTCDMSSELLFKLVM